MFEIILSLALYVAVVAFLIKGVFVYCDQKA